MMYISVLASKGTDMWIDNLRSCRETWCNTLQKDDELHFIFGDGKPNSYFGDGLVDPKSIELFKLVQGISQNDEIYYPVPDGYVSLLTYKTLLSIRDFLNTDHKFFVRTHTGSYLHLGGMHDVCSRLPTEKLYAGYVLTDESRKVDYAAGSCFVFSRDVAKMVWDNSFEFLSELYLDEFRGTWSALIDDVLFGKIVNGKYGVPITPLSRVCVVDSIDFDKDIPHYYMSGKSGKRREYYDIVHKKFLDLV